MSDPESANPTLPTEAPEPTGKPGIGKRFGQVVFLLGLISVVRGIVVERSASPVDELAQPTLVADAAATLPAPDITQAPPATAAAVPPVEQGGPIAAPRMGPMASLLPPIEGYASLLDLRMDEALEDAVDVGLQVATRTQLGKLANWADDTLACLSEAGALGSAIYRHEQRPAALGAVIAIDERELRSSTRVARCLLNPIPEDLLPFDEAVEDPDALRPCIHSYVIKGFEGAEATYRMIYLGSQDRVCRELCAGLPGCRAPASEKGEETRGGGDG